MAVDPITETTRLHRVLLKGRMVEREAAQRRILARDPAIDRALLRQLLMRSLESDFGAEVGRDDKSDKAWCRCWLLSCSGGWPTATTRSWTTCAGSSSRGSTRTAGPATGRWRPGRRAGDGLAALAATVAGGDTDSLVLALANALLASFGDAARSQKLLEQLSGGSRWEALRALRVVPIEATVERLCEIVGEKTITDDTLRRDRGPGRCRPTGRAPRQPATRSSSGCGSRGAIHGGTRCGRGRWARWGRSGAPPRRRR